MAGNQERSAFTRTGWQSADYIHKAYETADNQKCDGYLESQLTSLHQLSNKIGYKKNGRFLDFGCGAVMANVMSFSRIVDEMFLCDYSDDACGAVKEWIQKDEKAFNWKLSLQKQSEIEGEEATLDSIEERMRSKIKSVTHCNILEDDPLVGSDIPREYDVISTMHCLRLAVPDLVTYNVAVRKLTDLVIPGGYLVVGVNYDESYWTSGNVTYPVLSLSEHDVHGAITAAGLEITECHDISLPDVPAHDGSHTHNILARKPQN